MDKRYVRWVLAVFTLMVCACGDDGGGDASSNGPPTAAFTMDPTCTSSSTDPVTFQSTSTDPDDDELSCAWTFAGGTPGSATQCVVTGITFPSVASYEVVLIVDDGKGGTDSIRMPVAPCH